MRYESLKHRKHSVSVDEAVSRGLAPDGGLYMPERIPVLPASFFERARTMPYDEIAFEVTKPFFTPEISEEKLREICSDAFNFEVPLKEIEPGVNVLELYHGPTAAFKDFGARFMSRTLGHFAREKGMEVTVLVATSGDTGSAVAHGFLNVPGINVAILYPEGKVSPLQEKQLTGMGGNITAFEVRGVFDDCQAMVKEAFQDNAINNALTLTSANSISVARLIPQSTYYVYVATRFPKDTPLAVSVPSGNLGNLTAGLMAKAMGAPIHKFVAATNANRILPDYLESGEYQPRPSVQTLSNAMDVGNPSNFPRAKTLYANLENMREDIYGVSFTDKETTDAISDVHRKDGYTMDPHGAVAYLGLRDFQKKNPGYSGVFLETAHPAKFAEVVEPAIGEKVPMPDRLAEFLHKEKQAFRIKNFRDLKESLFALYGA